MPGSTDEFIFQSLIFPERKSTVLWQSHPQKREKKMYTCVRVTIMLSVVLAGTSIAAPVGAVLYREGSPVHHARYKVPADAAHHYFGYLEGPAWENRYVAYRVYVDKDNRNAIDFVSKYQPGPILHYFDDPTVDEHTNFSWGTDCFSVSSTMGLGHFRLFYNNQWLNPQLGSNLDSMVISILDSSTQTPKASIVFYGWNIGSGSKVTVTWIMSTSLNERPAHFDLTIEGNYTGKVVVGMVNNNKRNHPVTLIRDSTKALLATIGKQGAVGEGFTDTLLLAVFAHRSYFSSFADDAQNYGMVLTPDAGKKVTWSIASCWAKETDPIFRNPNWQDLLFPQTGIQNETGRLSPSTGNTIRSIKTDAHYQLYSLSGKKLTARYQTNGIRSHLPSGLYFVRDPSGLLVKRISYGSE
ncbi:MAG: DUF4861 family protein [Chitinispirillaceae bacterium]|nr:DUF4861 family protein [Chitinispirillaceae bacterium]